VRYSGDVDEGQADETVRRRESKKSKRRNDRCPTNDTLSMNGSLSLAMLSVDPTGVVSA
jgi:hypothetical protein